MTDNGRPLRRITLAFVGDSADVNVELDPDVTIGQLAVASWALAEHARDARQGQLIAEARRRAEIQTVAASLNAGRRT